MTAPEFNRREAIPVISAGIASFFTSPASAETSLSIESLKGGLADEVIKELEQEPEILAHVSTKKFWGEKGEANVASLKQNLISENKMYAPSVRQISELRGRLSAQDRLREHSAKLREGEYGVFLDGEHSRVPKKEQTEYLTKKEKGEVKFLIAFPVSTSFADWSRIPGSKGTPLDTYSVKRIERRLFGQLASNVVEHPDEFVNFPKQASGKTVNRYFPKSIHSGDKYAAITSGVLWIDEARNIGAHGSNKIGGLGFPASSGCIRMPNMAFFYLHKFIRVGAPMTIHGIPLNTKERRINDLIGGMEYK